MWLSSYIWALPWHTGQWNVGRSFEFKVILLLNWVLTTKAVLLIAERRIYWFKPFSRELVWIQCKQSQLELVFSFLFAFSSYVWPSMTTCLEHRSIKSKKTASSWQRKEVEGTPQKQLPTPTMPMTLRFWQIHPTNPKHYCIVWNELPQALASMSMHTKLNICALIRQVTFPHEMEPLWNW